DHPKHLTHRRVIRSKGHHTLPNIVGPFFPRDDPGHREYYCASILALLSPWRCIKELRTDLETWEEAF
ncbi:hypothetical protein EDD22DRAFT_764812, partial [Suillus occidentalis]